MDPYRLKRKIRNAVSDKYIVFFMIFTKKLNCHIILIIINLIKDIVIQK